MNSRSIPTVDPRSSGSEGRPSHFQTASDEDRPGAILEALDFAGKNRVLVFPHHRHMVELAQRHVPAENLALIAL